MASIEYAVGQGGRNQWRDVRTVQRLLNKYGSGGRALSLDGLAGRDTIEAIKNFQKTRVGMKTPDGRVDPGGKSLRFLNRGSDAAPAPDPAGKSAARKQGKGPAPADRQKENAAGRSDAREARRKFVRSAVKETAVTTRIIDHIQPDFEDIKATVISGYLNDSDRFWKINYHWEYLIWMIDHAITLDVDQREKKKLRQIRSQLIAHRPDPDTGYRTSGKVGKPADRSSMHAMNQRHKLLRQAKRDFKAIFRATGMKQKSSRNPKSFDLAAAPVAHPGTSKHGTGYALDIAGNNAQIKTVSKRVGATVVFDEQSHVHVEFKNLA